MSISGSVLQLNLLHYPKLDDINSGTNETLLDGIVAELFHSFGALAAHGRAHTVSAPVRSKAVVVCGMFSRLITDVKPDITKHIPFDPYSPTSCAVPTMLETAAVWP